MQAPQTEQSALPKVIQQPAPESENFGSCAAPQSRLIQCAFWIPIIGAGLLGIAQAVALGFYLDDWHWIVRPASLSSPFSAALFKEFLVADIARPGLIPFHFLLSSLLPPMPIFWHIGLVISNGLIALAIARFLAILAGGQRARNQLVWHGIAFLWTLIPWTCGSRLWPILLTVHLGMAAFIWMCTRLLGLWIQGKAPLLLPFFVYGYLLLMYEAFYFQFVVPVLIGFALVLARRAQSRHVLLSGSAMAAAQCIAAAWHWISPLLGVNQRSVFSHWQDYLSRSVRDLLPEITKAVGVPGWLLAVCFAALAGFTVVLHISAASPKTRLWNLPSTSLLAVGFMFGSSLSLVSFCLGGRYIAGVGVESRTFFFITAWMLCAAGLPVGLAVVSGRGFFLRALAMVLIALEFFLFAGAAARIHDWRKAAEKTHQTIESFPVDRLLPAPTGAVVLALMPLDVNGAPVIGASIGALEFAFHHSYPVLKAQAVRFVAYNHWLGFLDYDGATLRYEGGQTLADVVGTLFIWNSETKELIRAEAPLRVWHDRRLERLPKEGR